MCMTTTVGPYARMRVIGVGLRTRTHAELSVLAICMLMGLSH